MNSHHDAPPVQARSQLQELILRKHSTEQMQAQAICFRETPWEIRFFYRFLPFDPWGFLWIFTVLVWEPEPLSILWPVPGLGAEHGNQHLGFGEQHREGCAGGDASAIQPKAEGIPESFLFRW